jgi:hypothetical protein
MFRNGGPEGPHLKLCYLACLECLQYRFLSEIKDIDRALRYPRTPHASPDASNVEKETDRVDGPSDGSGS